MTPNLFFLSGPHGSGKTTFGEELAKENPRVMIPELYSRNVKFNTEPLDRLRLKICGRSIENFEYMQIARDNPDRLVLGNRCIYDQQVYDRVYHSHGWISDEDFYLSEVLAVNFYPGDLRNPNVIALNPGFDVVRKHLEKRWREKGKKWREDDLEYARLACQEYKPLKNKGNVFYIDHEIDLESKADVKEASEWMNSQILDFRPLVNN